MLLGQNETPYSYKDKAEVLGKHFANVTNVL